MQRTLNWKLVVWSVAILSIVGALVHVVHAAQVRRNAGSFLLFADRAKEAGDLDHALMFYKQYLIIEPDDAAALAHYALTLDLHATALPVGSRELVDVAAALENALAHTPRRDDIRLRLIHNLIRSHRFREAIANIQILLPRSENKAELEHIVGWCLEASGDYAESATAFRRAIMHDPGRVESYALLAEVLQNRLHDADQAAKIMNEAVEANGESFRAYLLRSQFRQTQQDAVGAESDLQKALVIAPNEPAVLLAAAAWARSNNDITQALVWLQSAHALEPRNESIVQALASVEVAAGHSADAEALLRTAVQEIPQSEELRLLLIDLLIDDGKLVEAETGIAGLSLDGNLTAPIDYLRARVAAAKGDWPKALPLVQSASTKLGTDSRWSVRAFVLRGDCFQHTGEYAKAIDSFQQAVSLGDAEPRCLVRLVQLLLSAKRYLDAEQVLDKAQLPLTPELARLRAEVALANQNSQEALQLAAQAVSTASSDYRDQLWLGRIYHGAGAEQQAEGAFRRAVALAPHAPEAWIDLVQQLTRMGRRQEAGVIRHEAQTKVPPRISVYTQARCYEVMGLVDRAETFYRQAFAQDPDDFVLLIQAAHFFEHTDQAEKAEPFLRALLASGAPTERLASARRHLALVLAAKGNGEVSKALALLAENLQGLPANSADLRARAWIEANPPAQRRRAIQVFEETARRQPLSTDEQIQLAQLYAADGNPSRAREEIIALLATQPESPRCLAVYIRHLIESGELDQARGPMQQLERLEPASQRTLALKKRLESM